MWVPKEVADWFKISKDSVDILREELAGVRVERDLLKAELATTKANWDWLRIQVNTLQFERAALMQKVYGTQVPVPEIARVGIEPREFSFDDVGDDVAHKLGLPTYN